MYSGLISGYKKILWFKSCFIKTSEAIKNFVGALLMDISKTFDCIPHDLLFAGFHVHSYLKCRKQGVKTNSTGECFPNTFIILFNILINDLFFFIKDV